MFIALVNQICIVKVSFFRRLIIKHTRLVNSIDKFLHPSCASIISNRDTAGFEILEEIYYFTTSNPLYRTIYTEIYALNMSDLERIHVESL